LDLPILFWIAFYLWIGSEFAIAIRTKKKRKNISATKRDKGSYWLIIFGVWLGSFFSFQFHFLHWGWMGSGKILSYLGIFLMIFGVFFRLLAIRTLGRHFNLAVEVDKEQTIVQTGPYKYIRHPSYTGAFFTLIGLGIALNSWVAILLLFLMFWIMYGYRIRIEEQALLEHFQTEYERYQKRTWRILPFIW
jgi:protein-S-isoprenylcysteine O-methyltransferase Ste14